MIQNTSAVLLLGLFFIFLYYLKEYIEKNFVTEENKKIFNHVDLLFIFPAFISIIWFAVILIQSDVNNQNNMLVVWIEFLILLFGPIVYIIVVAFIKSMIQFVKRKRGTIEHE